MLFIHFLCQERIDTRYGDRFQRPPSVKQLNKERPHRTAAALDRSWRKISVFFHKSSDRKSTRLNSSHQIISYAVFCLKKKKDRSGHGQALFTRDRSERVGGRRADSRR